VCASPDCPVHHPKKHKTGADAAFKAEQEKSRRADALAQATGIRTLAAIVVAVPVRLMKRDLLFVAERLAGVLDENCLTLVARQHGIKKAKDSDSDAKLFAAYLCRAEESALGSILVELTIALSATRSNSAQVLRDAAAEYKVDTDAIALKVKHEFAAKEKTAEKGVAKVHPKAAKKTKTASSSPFLCGSLLTGRLLFLRPSSRPWALPLAGVAAPCPPPPRACNHEGISLHHRCVSMHNPAVNGNESRRPITPSTYIRDTTAPVFSLETWYLVSEGMQSMRVILVNSDRLSSFSYQLKWGGFVR